MPITFDAAGDMYTVLTTVCLFVCLWTEWIKKLCEHFHEIWGTSRLVTREELIKFNRLGLETGVRVRVAHLLFPSNDTGRVGGIHSPECPL